MAGIDFTNGTWSQIAAWANEQLQAARARNDAPDLTPEKTALLRGEIQFIKRLLGLPEAAARAQKAESAVQSPFGGFEP